MPIYPNYDHTFPEAIIPKSFGRRHCRAQDYARRQQFVYDHLSLEHVYSLLDKIFSKFVTIM